MEGGEQPSVSPEVTVCAELALLVLSREVTFNSFAAPRTVAHQAPLSLGFSRQEYCSGLPFPSPEDLPDPGIEPMSPALQPDSLPLNHLGSPEMALRWFLLTPRRRYLVGAETPGESLAF